MTDTTAQDIEQEEDSADSFVKDTTDKYRRARLHWSKWKKRTRRNYDYYAGRQWTQEEQDELGEGKAAVVMNRIKPRVSAVVGMEISNRQELRYQPREVSDEALASLVNKASEWTRDQADTEDHETDQFQDMVICGIGASETFMDHEDNIDGVAVTERRDPLGYDWDPDSTQANFADLEFYFYSQDITKDQFKAMGFPIGKARGGALGINDLWETQDQPHDADNDQYYPTEVPAYSGSDQGKPLKKVRLVRMEYIGRVKKWRVMMPDGSMRSVEPSKAKEIEEDMAARGTPAVFVEYDSNEDMVSGVQPVVEGAVLVLPYVAQMEKRCRRAYFTGNELLKDELAPCPHAFSDQFMTGWRDHTEGTWFGMVDGLIDPQEWSNKFLSQAIYIYTVNPKGGMIAKKKAFENPSDVEDNYAAPDKITWARDDANLETDIKDIKPGAYPADLDKLSAFAINSLPALDGLTPEAMGQVARNQPGILENMRKQAGMTVLAPLFNAKRRYHKRQGRVLLHFISRFFTAGQLARIAGQPIPPETMQALRRVDVRTYDIVTDDAPTSPNAKEFTLNVLIELVRQAPAAALALMPLMISKTPLPLEDQQAIAKALQSFSDPENTPQGQEAKKQIEKLTKENAQLKSGAQIEMAKIGAKTAGDMAKLHQRDDEADAKMELERDWMKSEMAQFFAQLRQEWELAMMEMRNNLQIAREKPDQPQGNA